MCINPDFYLMRSHIWEVHQATQVLITYNTCCMAWEVHHSSAHHLQHMLYGMGSAPLKCSSPTTHAVWHGKCTTQVLITYNTCCMAWEVHHSSAHHLQHMLYGMGSAPLKCSSPTTHAVWHGKCTTQVLITYNTCCMAWFSDSFQKVYQMKHSKLPRVLSYKVYLHPHQTQIQTHLVQFQV